VEYLVEVCDPPEAAEFGYTVNDILVSDFHTPRFFDPVRSVATRYSFTGAVERPRQVLRGGYLSWHDPKSWWQQVWFGARKEYRDLGVFDVAKHGSLRSFIDSETDHPGIHKGLPKSDSSLRAAVQAGKETASSAASKADSWRAQYRTVIEESRR
jgi:hypothetical protein